MKKVALTEVNDDLSKYLRLAAKEDIVITRHGKPAGVLVGFDNEDDWFDYRLENDPQFLKRIASAKEPAKRQGSPARRRWRREAPHAKEIANRRASVSPAVLSVQQS